jgi:subfamily B ATP-binding cassette protein MsbA
MVSTAATSIIKDSFTTNALLFVVFYRDLQLACWAIGVFPIVFSPIVFFGRKVRRVSTGCQPGSNGKTQFISP